MSGAPKPEDVKAVYDRMAVAFNTRRQNSEMEASWIARFVDPLPKGAEVLDLGCGSGEPVARTLLAHGCQVTGVDVSTKMLALAQGQFPQARWVQADMVQLDLGQRFDGIVAWHSIFHLTVAAQRRALPRILDHLKPGGVILMTTGLEEGESHGHVEGDIVYHASLDRAEYAAILEASGFKVLDFVAGDTSCGGANVWLAQRSD